MFQISQLCLSLFVVCLFSINNAYPALYMTFHSENDSSKSEIHIQGERNDNSNSILKTNEDVGRESKYLQKCYETCFCGVYSIDCKYSDTLKGFKPIRKPASFTKINIMNQPGFESLKAKDLEQFVNLESLTIRNSGLKMIEEDAFHGNKKLVYLNLESNALTSFNWKLIRHIKFKIHVSLLKNPLKCSCSLAFLHNRLNYHQNVDDGNVGGNDDDGGGYIDNTDDGEYEEDYDDGGGGGDDDDLKEMMCSDDQGRVHSVTKFPGSTECAFPKAQLDTNLTYTNNSELSVTCLGQPLFDPSLKVNWIVPQNHEDVIMRVVSVSEVMMTIKNLSALSMGEFFCEVESEQGFNRANWTLLVYSSPIIEDIQKNELYPDVLLTYKVIGFPKPSIEWYRNGQLMVFRDDDVKHKELDEGKSYLAIGWLLLRAPFYVDGNFTLVATNSEGSTNSTINLFSDGGNAPVKLDGSYANGFKKAFGSNLTQNDNNRTPTLSMWLLILFGILIAILIIFFIIISVKYKSLKNIKPNSFQGDFFKRKNSNYGSKRGKGLNHEGRRLERVRRSRLATFCLEGPEGGRPVRRENIPLSIDHVVQNPNYEGSNGVAEDSQGFGQGGFMDERCLLGMSAVPKIPSSDIECLQELGEGAFGLVYLGTLKTRDPVTKETTRLSVAIKTVKDCHFENNRRDFDREATMLSGLKHENIVTLYGVSIDMQPHMIVLEYMEFGDLCNFLRTYGPEGEMLTPKITHHLFSPRPSFKRSLTQLDLLTIATQIARGGAYLAQQHFVHRDLATRNCLVGADLVVKIGDFGMSRDVYATDYYKVGSHLLMPVRWMPPESIVYKTFSVESDVWSFGVVLWEIYTFGKQPWYELSNVEVIQNIQQGNVMPCPSSCPHEVYLLMLKCWHKDPRERISLQKMYNQLDAILTHQQQPGDLHQRHQQKVNDPRKWEVIDPHHSTPKRFSDLHPSITLGVRKDAPRSTGMRAHAYLELIDS